MHLFKLAWQSALYRRYTLILTLLSVMLSVFLVLGVEKIRESAASSFENSLSGTDLIVGARGSATQLLLYSVFRIGDATQNMAWDSYEKLSHHPAVAWTIPISLGDSHHGYPVLATNNNYIAHYQYGDHQPLHIQQGKWLAGLYDVVIGSSVANELNYRVGQSIVLSHGSGSGVNLIAHQDKPFHVVGVLAPTGTAVDRTLHIGLAAMEAIHLDWQAGVPIKGFHIPANLVGKFDLTPKSITATLVGLNNRIDVFRLQRQIDQYQKDPLQAIIPGVVIDQLWQMLGFVEKSLRLLSGLVFAVSLAGLVTLLLANLNERKKEFAILRAVGAKPYQLLLMILLEMTVLMALGLIGGTGLLLIFTQWLSPWILTNFGLDLSLSTFTLNDLTQLAYLLLATFIAGFIPAIRAYRLSLAGTLTS
ncbi:ABC transporter permease [Leeia sp. TBRC 13508]|uniref:ABC transporter permease n=1 Tax=Leeia speluncae TaxID=2884804 RepID=A0ABS8D9Q4_9NEIS|nr:ABC transporter permease [Leeia speluncae]MCB6184930.1 ABC transporter permease [Leeia speluncae]